MPDGDVEALPLGVRDSEMLALSAREFEALALVVAVVLADDTPVCDADELGVGEGEPELYAVLVGDGDAEALLAFAGHSATARMWLV